MNNACGAFEKVSGEWWDGNITGYPRRRPMGRTTGWLGNDRGGLRAQSRIQIIGQ